MIFATDQKTNKYYFCEKYLTVATVSRLIGATQMQGQGMKGRILMKLLG